MHASSFKGTVPFQTRLALQRARNSMAVQPVKCSLKLYANPRSRSKIVEWYLKELKADYSTVAVDFSKGEHKSPEFLKIHPLGQLPAIQDGDLNLFESGAILLYLADKHGETTTVEQRAIAAQWVLFANSTLGNALFLESIRERQLPSVMEALTRVLDGKDYLTGEFSVADVAVGAYLLYVPLLAPQVDLNTWPVVLAYMQRLEARAAYQDSFAAQVAGTG